MATLRTKRFRTEIEMVNYVNGLSSTTTAAITITQEADVAEVEIDSIDFGIPIEDDEITVTIAAVDFVYTVLAGDDAEAVATAIKALIDANIAGAPSGPVDDLIDTPTVVDGQLIITGQDVDVELELTSDITFTTYTYKNSHVINTPNRAITGGLFESWVLLYE